MIKTPFPGVGRKRPLFDIGISRLHLDGENPRLPEDAHGKSEAELLEVILRVFSLDELADSMAKNGYFDEEPLVGVPRALPRSLASVSADSPRFMEYILKPTTQLTVVEGNRRLAAATLLLDRELRARLKLKHWPEVSPEVADDLRVLPIIVYVRREEVTAYLGVRHIVGIQKWDAYAKARYIAAMVENGLPIPAIEAQIGDRQGAVTMNYVSFQLLEQAKAEFDLDARNAKGNFSLLLLALGQGNIKRFLGLPRRLAEANMREPVPRDNLQSLRDLLVWVFGDGRRRPVISDSREITRYLSHVVASPESLEYLRTTSDLLGAYERSDGEEALLLKFIVAANQKLEGALGIAHRHRIPEAQTEAEKCEKTVKALLKTLKEHEVD